MPSRGDVVNRVMSASHCSILKRASALERPMRMKRRNTVSVTPAIGASTVAGAIPIFPILNCCGKLKTSF